ncbi:MAG: hypothetical protein IKH76_03700, partial [Clostridiales bacterium]|nr:hypothetical protein [Clostridiales bacterium]
MKSRFSGKKIMSFILCAVFTAHIGYAVYAADEDPQDPRRKGSVTVSGSSVSLSQSGGYSTAFEITKSGSSYHVVCTAYTSDDTDVYVDNITSLGVYGETFVTINADIEASLFVSEYAEASIAEGYTYDCSSLSGNMGIVRVNGTFVLDDLRVADYSTSDNLVAIDNYGTITADTIDLTGDSRLTNYDGSKLKATTSFTKGEEDLSAEVVAAKSTTYITSGGGTFKLTLGDLSKTIEGDVSGQAGDFIYEDTSVSLSSMPDSAKKVYVGQDYDFSQYIRVTPSTYDGDPYIEYNVTEPADSTDYADTKHTAPGSYRARAVAPQVPGFRESVSEPVDYTIEYLPIDEVGDDPYTLKGIKNEFYVADKLTLVPADGFKVSSGDSYKDKIEFGKSDLFDDTGNARDIELSYKRTSDDAETDTYRWNKDDYKDLIFDEYDPGIFGEMADGVETSIEDGDVVVADSLSFEVYDDNLDKVIIDGTTYTGSDFEEGSLEVTLTSVVASPKDISVYAIDKAGRELELSFTLRHTPVDPDEAVVKVKDTYVGDDYEPKVTTDSDGEVSFVYRDLNGDPEDYFETKPTAAGKYEVIAYIAATDNYNEIECTDTFTISKR